MITQGANSKDRLGLVFTLVLHCFPLLFSHCLTLQQLQLQVSLGAHEGRLEVR